MRSRTAGQLDSRTAGQPDSRTAMGQLGQIVRLGKSLYPLCHVGDTTRRRLRTSTLPRVCATGFIYSIYISKESIIYMTI
jgi:hypothetical protein